MRRSLLLLGLQCDGESASEDRRPSTLDTTTLTFERGTIQQPTRGTSIKFGAYVLSACQLLHVTPVTACLMSRTTSPLGHPSHHDRCHYASIPHISHGSCQPCRHRPSGPDIKHVSACRSFHVILRVLSHNHSLRQLHLLSYNCQRFVKDSPDLHVILARLVPDM